MWPAGERLELARGRTLRLVTVNYQSFYSQFVDLPDGRTLYGGAGVEYCYAVAQLLGLRATIGGIVRPAVKTSTSWNHSSDEWVADSAGDMLTKDFNSISVLKSSATPDRFHYFGLAYPSWTTFFGYMYKADMVDFKEEGAEFTWSYEAKFHWEVWLMLCLVCVANSLLRPVIMGGAWVSDILDGLFDTVSVVLRTKSSFEPEARLWQTSVVLFAFLMTEFYKSEVMGSGIFLVGHLPIYDRHSLESSLRGRETRLVLTSSTSSAMEMLQMSQLNFHRLLLAHPPIFHRNDPAVFRWGMEEQNGVYVGSLGSLKYRMKDLSSDFIIKPDKSFKKHKVLMVGKGNPLVGPLSYAAVALQESGLAQHLLSGHRKFRLRGEKNRKRSGAVAEGRVVRRETRGLGRRDLLSLPMLRGWLRNLAIVYLAVLLLLLVENATLITAFFI